MNIKKFINDYPVILAPMSGVTDLPFRSIVKELGAGLLVSEMIASRAMILKTRQSLQKSQVIENTAVQLAGCEEDIMAEAAKLNEDMGARIIDINFGCPVKKVVNGYAGSALMKDEIKAAKILEKVVSAVKIPVTLKMRMGWNADNLNAAKLAKIAENLGIKMIAIHGRTRAQMYNGKADWDFIRTVKESVKIPVIANGDIKDFTDITEVLYKSAADGIMIGRGVYGKPWFINQALHFIKTGIKLEEPSKNEKLDIIMKHYDNTISYYGKDVGLKISRKHISWYSTGIVGASEFRAKINMIDEESKMRQSIINFFSN